MKFLDFVASQYMEQPYSPVKDACAVLLMRMLMKLRAVMSDDYSHKQFQNIIDNLRKSIQGVLDYQRHKIGHLSVAFYGIVVSLSGKAFFLENLSNLIAVLLAAIKDETSGAMQATLWCSLRVVIWTYYYRYSEAWATMLERSETALFSQLFPKGRRYVLGVDIEISGAVDLLGVISRKLPSYSLNEILKRLVKQANSSLQKPLDSFPVDRALIVCMLFAKFVKTAGQKEMPDLSFPEESQRPLEEYRKPKANVNDLDLKGMSSSVIQMINGSLQLIGKSCKIGSGTEGGYLVLDATKARLIRYLDHLLDSYYTVIKVQYLYELYHCNNEALSRKARDSLIKLNRMPMHDDKGAIAETLCGCMIGQLVNDQKPAFTKSVAMFKDLHLNPKEHPAVEALVYFAKRFDVLSLLPFSVSANNDFGPNENSFPVYKIGLGHLLEYIHGWSTAWGSNPALAKKVSEAEMEHFGKIADIYLELDSSFSLILKDIYREKQRKKNLLIRSWNSLVGYKKTSKEIVEFIMSLLDYPSADVRFRVIQAFGHVPVEKVTDYLKRIERLRQEVSYDFVNLNYDNSRKNRRFELLKREVTMLCTNFLHVIHDATVSSEKMIMTPLRVIVRHLAEMYYFLIKLGQADDFLNTLRADFLRMLYRYADILCSSAANTFSPAQRASLLPYRFRWELWLSLESWFDKSQDGEERVLIVGCMSKLAYGMISLDGQDDANLSLIMHWVSKLQQNRSLHEYAVVTLYNLLISSSAVSIEPIFNKIACQVYENVDDTTVLIYCESISRAIDEIVSMLPPVRFFLLSVLYYGSLNEKLHRISQNLLRKSFNCESLDLVPATQDSAFAKQIVMEVAVALPVVQRPACQKRLLRLLLLFIDNFVEDGMDDGANLDLLIEKLYWISTYLMETFDDDIQRIWRKLGNEKIISTVIERFIGERLSSRMVVMILEALNNQPFVITRLAEYANPANAATEAALLPAKTALSLITKMDAKFAYPFLFDALKLSRFGSDGLVSEEWSFLEQWLYCPVAEVSVAVIFEFCQRLPHLDMNVVIEMFGNYVSLIKAEQDVDSILEALAIFFESCIDLQNLSGSHFISIVEMSLALVSRHSRRYSEIITKILQYSDLWADAPLLEICQCFSTHYPEALTDLLRLDPLPPSDRVVYYILGAVPQLLEYFDKFLALSARGSNSSHRESLAIDPAFTQTLTALMTAVRGNAEFWQLLLSMEQKKSRPAVDFYRSLASCLLSTIPLQQLVPFLTGWNERNQSNGNAIGHKLSFMLVDRLRVEAQPIQEPTLIYPFMESLRYWDASLVAVGPCFEYLNSQDVY